MPKPLFFLVALAYTADSIFLEKPVDKISYGACHQIRVSAPAPSQNSIVIKLADQNVTE